MKKLIILPSQDSPEVRFDPAGHLSISGISVPENVNLFYQEIFEWIEEFKSNMPSEVILDLKLEYMNTSSVKMIVALLKELHQYCEAEQSKFQVNWICDQDDEDLIEEGELLEESVGIKFNLVYT
ncbi:MAG: DUF1987 domain-containing protein [Bacteroidetes bacterium]|nr:MAG: DUF1987 domain-containing protein [Bacteroidota bacterium]